MSKAYMYRRTFTFTRIENILYIYVSYSNGTTNRVVYRIRQRIYLHICNSLSKMWGFYLLWAVEDILSSVTCGMRSILLRSLGLCGLHLQNTRLKQPPGRLRNLGHFYSVVLHKNRAVEVLTVRKIIHSFFADLPTTKASNSREFPRGS